MDDLFAPVPISTASAVGGVGGTQLHNATPLGLFDKNQLHSDEVRVGTKISLARLLVTFLQIPCASISLLPPGPI